MYALITNNAVAKYPYSVSGLSKDNPQTSFPSELSDSKLAEYGVFQVHTASRPASDYTKNVAEGQPTFSSERNRWEQVWVVTDATEEEVAQRTAAKAAAVRNERNQRLKDCDWTQLDDTPITNSKKLEWAAYRQSLRDISAQAGFPWSVTWPEMPA